MAAELLTRLQDLDVVITADGTGLDVDGPEAVLTDELLNEIAAHKAELIGLLAPTSKEGIDWRLRAMLDQIASWGGSGIPFLVARRDATVQEGDCPSCGDPLPPGSKWRCPPCVEAARQATMGALTQVSSRPSDAAETSDLPRLV